MQNFYTAEFCHVICRRSCDNKKLTQEIDNYVRTVIIIDKKTPHFGKEYDIFRIMKFVSTQISLLKYKTINFIGRKYISLHNYSRE